MAVTVSQENDGPVVVDNPEAIPHLRQFFQLDTDMDPMVQRWLSDPNFGKKYRGLEGVRVLKIPPVECLLSFICSSCNNIPRITLMIQAMCEEYGNKVGDMYTVPSLDKLVGSEERLRQLGFGYRAKYIDQTASMLLELSQNQTVDQFLQGWTYQSGPYEEQYQQVKQQIMQLPGVGPKVADCVMLYSLGWYNCIPVDTHIHQVAVRDYKYKGKTVNKKSYAEISKLFYDIFGEYCGWAHSLLFVADLKMWAADSSQIADETVILKVDQDQAVQPDKENRPRKRQKK